MAKPTDDTRIARADQVQQRLRSYRQLLARLLRSEALSTGDIETAYRQVTELAVQLLDVERASVWRLNPTNRKLRCFDLFERSKDAHSEGQVISAKQVPAYFEAIGDERCLAAHDAHLDPRTAGFSNTYLRPLGIGALLDAPIWVSGRVVGVVCHEHVGEARHWEFEEELLAGTVADFVARVLEAADRLRAERVLGQYRQHVQELVGLRGRQVERLNVVLQREVSELHALRDHERELEETRRVFDASPVPMVLTRLADAEVRYVNARAAELFEYSVHEMIGKRAPDFYTSSADRAAFVAELRGSGRVDGFVAELRTRSGRPFWALMSAVCLAYEGDECFMVGFSDVTAQKLAEFAVTQGAQSLRALFAAAPVALVLSRLSDKTVVLANQRAADLFEVPLSQVVGEKTPDYYVDPAERDEIVARLVRDGHIEQGATRMRTRTGREFWATISGRVLEFESEMCVLVGAHDVTAQKELEEQLRELATRDALTGLWNRRHFMELAGREVKRVSRARAALALCILDADQFKRINDMHGHPAGDRVLVALARAAESVLRSSDVLARVGGEEFHVLLPDTDAAGAAGVAERIREAIANVSVRSENGAAIRPTVSIGVTVYRRGDDLQALLHRADAALYRAKEQGRNRVATD
ncbi:MAG TPA: diguanylate cyclase [Polyangiaceae bacterium]|nr:diguanylate cyclase [Polyangiaceae bacterium]